MIVWLVCPQAGADKEKHTEASFNSVCARVERSGITERKNLQTRLGVMYNPHVIITIILKNNG